MATSGEGSGIVHVHVEDGRSTRSANRLRSTLTAKQLLILRLAAMGYTNKAIAGHLGVSEQTVKNHRAKVHTRLDVTTLVEAMNALGWVEIT